MKLKVQCLSCDKLVLVNLDELNKHDGKKIDIHCPDCKNVIFRIVTHYLHKESFDMFEALFGKNANFKTDKGN